MKQFESVTIEYPGKEKPLTITRRDMSGKMPPPAKAGVAPMRVNETSKAPHQIMRFPIARLLAYPDMLFQGLYRTAKPIKDGSRRYSVGDRDFMSKKIKRVLEAGIVKRLDNNNQPGFWLVGCLSRSHFTLRASPLHSNRWLGGTFSDRMFLKS